MELAAMLKDHHEKALQAHAAAITTAHTQAKEQYTRKSRRSSATGG
jgi:hypothetical protein